MCRMCQIITVEINFRLICTIDLKVNLTSIPILDTFCNTQNLIKGKSYHNTC